jgi:hypothetical protein
MHSEGIELKGSNEYHHATSRKLHLPRAFASVADSERGVMIRNNELVGMMVAALLLLIAPTRPGAAPTEDRSMHQVKQEFTIGARRG